MTWSHLPKFSLIHFGWKRESHITWSYKCVCFVSKVRGFVWTKNREHMGKNFASTHDLRQCWDKKVHAVITTEQIYRKPCCCGKCTMQLAYSEVQLKSKTAKLESCIGELREINNTVGISVHHFVTFDWLVRWSSQNDLQLQGDNFLNKPKTLELCTQFLSKRGPETLERPSDTVKWRRLKAKSSEGDGVWSGLLIPGVDQVPHLYTQLYAVRSSNPSFWLASRPSMISSVESANSTVLQNKWWSVDQSFKSHSQTV